MEKERTEAEGNSLVDLETARLVLTPVTEEHIDPICAHFTKEVVTYMVPGPAKERGDMEAVVRRFMEPAAGRHGFCICHHAEGEQRIYRRCQPAPCAGSSAGAWHLDKDGGARASLWKGSHWGDASAGRFHGDRPAVLSWSTGGMCRVEKSRCITAGGGQTRSVWCVRRTAGRSKRNDTKSKPEAGRRPALNRDGRPAFFMEK